MCRSQVKVSGFSLGLCSWTSSLFDFLYLPIIPVWGASVYLWHQFSDGYKMSCWFSVCSVLLFLLLLFFHLFLLVGGELLYNIVVVFAIHWHESAMDLHVFPIPIPHLDPPSHLPLHSIPLCLPSFVVSLGVMSFKHLPCQLATQNFSTFNQYLELYLITPGHILAS